MQRATHPTLIGLVRDHVEAWRRENGWSRESVADMIVQAHDRIGGPLFSGIAFDPPTRDTFERMRVNADRIFRWLDDTSKDKNLLPANFLWTILAALPMNRRLALANDLMQPVDIAVRGMIEGDDEPTAQEIAERFRDVAEHSSTATVAMSHMLDGVHAGEAEHAEAKLTIASAAIKRARGLVARILRRKRV